MEITNEFMISNTKEEDTDCLEQFRAARFAYRIGKPIITDMQYDELREDILNQYPNTEELFHVYEEDKIIPTELIKYGIDPFDIEVYSQQRSIVREFKFPQSKELMEEDNKSIISMKTVEEEYNAFVSLGTGTYILSPKIDGVFCSVIYEREQDNVFQMKCGKSRGDMLSSIDITNTVSNILPQTILLDIKEDVVKFNFEGTYDFELVKTAGYANQRSACQGIFASTVNKKTALHSGVIMLCHGSSLLMKYEDAMGVAISAGFTTVPLSRYEFDSEMSLDEFKESIEPLKKDIKYWHAMNRIEADGVVAVKEDFTDAVDATRGSKQYNKNVFALKADYWNNGYYEAKIVGFAAEQQNSDISYTILFEPMVMPDGKTQSKITDIRLRAIRDAKMKIGDTVGFYYLNATTIKFKEKVVKEDCLQDG